MQDDGPRGCKLLLVGNKRGFVNPVLYVSSGKGPAISVPAAPVIRKGRAFSRFIGVKGGVWGPFRGVGKFGGHNRKSVL